MLKRLATIFVILLAALLLFATTRPASFRVERSTLIQAAPQTIFANVNNFHRRAAWSPWQRLDPAMATSYTGAAAGPGAVYEWEGNSKVGKGRMEVVDSTVPSDVKIKLDFLKPFEGHNITDFLMEPAGDATKVSWVMVGPNPYLAKLIGIFLPMDKMIGGDFKRGLANLKAVSEANPT